LLLLLMMVMMIHKCHRWTKCKRWKKMKRKRMKKKFWPIKFIVWENQRMKYGKRTIIFTYAQLIHSYMLLIVFFKRQQEIERDKKKSKAHVEFFESIQNKHVLSTTRQWMLIFPFFFFGEEVFTYNSLYYMNVFILGQIIQ